MKIRLPDGDHGDYDDNDDVHDQVACCRHKKVADPPWVAKLGQAVPSSGDAISFFCSYSDCLHMC